MPDRYRDRPPSADDDYGRDDSGAPQRGTESDPLAELARLIGQTDPFSSFGREGQQASQHDDEYAADDAPVYDDEPAPTPSWMRNRPPAAGASYGDPYDAPQEEPYPANDRGYGEPRFGDQRNDAPAGGSRYEDVLFGEPARDARRGPPQPDQDSRYSEDRYDESYYEDGVDVDAPKRRRGGLTAVVVLLLAVVGTAAAFGYRTFIGSPRSGEPPIIKADAGPNKVVPAGTDAGKIPDRVGDQGAERVVSREEQPVDLNGKTQPRVVFPPLTQNANPPNASSANTAARPTGTGVGNGTLAGDEPRKIRTLAIRPDGDQSAAPPATAPAPAAVPARAVQAPPAPAPAQAARPAPPTTASTAPVSLTPQTQTAAPDARPRVASISSSAGAAGGGSYVQVSSQKTEADAQASFKAIQAKYSAVIGSRTSSIRRADLGEKGVFYRAMVGPFGTTDEATQFCVNLKAAGGQCIVQRN